MGEPTSPPGNGLLLINKKSGPSSHEVVEEIRNSLGTRSVGHAGTLDPLAEGLLLLMVGRATKLAPWLSGLGKEYKGRLLFGEETDTGDAAGTIIAQSDHPLAAEDLSRASREFSGDLEQTPPQFSAVKIRGRPAHKSARQGRIVDLPPRRVRVDSLQLKPYWVGSRLAGADYHVSCSKGTYIRALVRDIGRFCGSRAYVHTLTRLSVGRFHLDEAYTTGEVDRACKKGAATSILIPPRDGPELTELEANRDAAIAFFSGRKLDPSQVEIPPEATYGLEVKIIQSDKGNLVGIGRIEQTGLNLEVRPVRMIEGVYE